MADFCVGHADRSQTYTFVCVHVTTKACTHTHNLSSSPCMQALPGQSYRYKDIVSVRLRLACVTNSGCEIYHFYVQVVPLANKYVLCTPNIILSQISILMN